MNCFPSPGGGPRTLLCDPACHLLSRSAYSTLKMEALMCLRNVGWFSTDYTTLYHQKIIVLFITSGVRTSNPTSLHIVPRWQYLLGYRPRHLIFHTLYSRLHRRYYNRLLQTVPTLTVLNIALSRDTPIPVLYRTLGALDCRPISSARRLAADWRLQALFLTANW
jgi:hypothetical protein